MQRQSIIVGIDPGTTLGYCALSLDGTPILSASSKLDRFEEMLARLTETGCVIAIGVDKKKAPSLARRLAAKTGARLITPPSDASVEEKRRITQELPFQNSHERDAASGAVFAHRTLRDIIHKVIQKTAHLPAQERLAIERLVLRDGCSIQDAMESIAHPEATEEESLPAQQHIDIRLRLSRARARLLTRQVARLHERIRELRRALKKMRAKKTKRAPDDRPLRYELEGLVRTQKEGQRIIPLFQTLRDHALGAHPFTLPLDVAAVMHTPRGPIIIADGTPLSAEGILKHTSAHLCLIDQKTLADRKRPSTLIHDIIQEHRTSRTTAQRR